MKWQYWLIILLAVAIGIRALFFITFPAKLMWTGDTTSYFGTTIRMASEHIISDPWRTPIYPMILAIPYYLQGIPVPPEFPQGFSYELFSIRIAQTVAGILTVVILFFLVKALGMSNKYAGYYSIFIACSTTLMAFEYTLLTEAFSVLWLVGIVYVFVRLLDKLTGVRFIIFTVLLVIGTLLRPIYLLFPFLLIPLLVFRYQSRRMVIMAVATLLLYCGILLGYMQINKAQNGYFGISRISDVNLLGKILVLKIPVDSTSDIGGMKARVSSYIQTIGIADPWQVFVNNPILYKIETAPALSTFVRRVVFNNLGIFFIRSTKELPRAFMDVSKTAEFYKWDLPLSPLYPAFYLLWVFYNSSQIVNLIVIPAIVVSLILLFRRPEKKIMMRIGLTLVCGYHILFGLYLGYEDYGRHLAVMQPILYLVSFFWWQRIIRI